MEGNYRRKSYLSKARTKLLEMSYSTALQVLVSGVGEWCLEPAIPYGRVLLVVLCRARTLKTSGKASGKMCQPNNHFWVKILIAIPWPGQPFGAALSENGVAGPENHYKVSSVNMRLPEDMPCLQVIS